MTTLADTRREYEHDSLSKNQLNENPFTQMQQWLEQAQKANLKDATVMTLATAGKDGMPDARIVMLKQFDESSFCWYNSYASRKGQQISENPQACLLFYWREFEQQVRIQGKVEKLSAEEADEYFHSRPLGSQFSAAASQQSHPISSRKALQDRVDQLIQDNPDAVSKPDDWGGYRLTPVTFEFWQGRASRLHDRFTYTLDEAGKWVITRLQP
ncbi:MAG: pyridoxamine 5'-phosphate oxidase [endosymbiont of Galathealinum brachiosum]|uniref:Pyridoxine/pyridoxamine 5'-phosphate oxidase n=1 Tax=endosymbiont of Galathealinum brachiosum TaxID=2200906 RepID=A0A370DJ78_9GAMM|nr:MAG: pyridoxamine 5'-phosphate oxidase [endosymbiont of Galathealinum brachiosum]